MAEVRDTVITASDGHEVHGTLYKVPGGSGACLLVHGITADRHEWGLFDYLAAELAKRDITALAIDYRGHGQSSKTINELSLAGVYLDIAAAWADLGRHTSPNAAGRRIMIGNSFGGGLSYLFGQVHPSVDAVIMSCPVTNYIADLTRANPGWSAQIKDGGIAYASKTLDARITCEMYAFDDLISNLSIRKQLEVVHGTMDSDVPISETEVFVTEREPAARMHALVGMDHSFSAPEGTPDRNQVSDIFRRRAAIYIADLAAAL